MTEKKVQEYTVDLENLIDRNDLHRRLRMDLPLPVGYGNNLDALYDVLTEPMEPCRIWFLHFRDAEEALGAYASAFRHMLEDVMEENEDVECRFS